MKQDIHHHFIPEILKKYVKDLPEWSVEKTLQFIKEKGKEKAILSLSHYEINFTSKDEYVGFCHQANLELRDVIRDSKGKIGGFGLLPFPYIDSCIKELRTCLSYGFEGIVLYSNINGIYPSSIEHEKLFRELDERGVNIFIHPGSEFKANGMDYDGIIPAVEEIVDVARLFCRLVVEDTFESFPGLSFVLAHGGGLFPYQYSRVWKLVYFTNDGDDFKIQWRKIISDMLRKKFRYEDFMSRVKIDTCDFDRPEHQAVLSTYFSKEQCLYGSNYPM